MRISADPIKLGSIPPIFPPMLVSEFFPAAKHVTVPWNNLLANSHRMYK